jgi:hypothetical protein
VTSMRTFVSIAALAASLAACSSPAELLAQEDVNARLAGMRDRATADDCTEAGRAAGKCILETQPFVVGDLKIDDASPETVMLVDELPALTLGAIRYQHRIAGYYRWTPEGTLDDRPFELEAPRTLREILTSLQTPEFVPAERYVSLAPTLLRQYTSTNKNSLLHGTLTFNILAEHLPKHAIVLVNAPQLDTALGGCDAIGSADTIAKIRYRYESFANDIRSIIKKHNVRYVNLSAGTDIPGLKRNWRDLKCSGPMPSDDFFRSYLEALAPKYEALFATPNVIATQAASYDIFPAADAPFDQTSPRFYNRVRVGALAVLESGLDEVGIGPSYDFAKFRPAFGGADVYVNTGIFDRRGKELASMPLLMADGFGTTVFPAAPGTSTSWAAPLALSRLVSLRESRHAGVPFDDALIATLFDELAPRGCDTLPDQRCIFQDPLKHGQTEDLRLGYRPRVFTPLE